MTISQPIRVLMVGSNLRAANGVASFQMNYLRHLPPHLVHFDFAVLEDRPSPYAAEIRARGGEIYLLPSLRHPARHLQTCRRLLRQGRYDVIHDNTLIKSLPLMREARRQGIPVRILHSHSSRLSVSPKKAAVTRLLLPLLRRQCTHRAACTAQAGTNLFGTGAVQLLPNAVDIEAFAPDPGRRRAIRASLGDSDALVVGSVGRLAGEKNPRFAVDAFACLLQRLPQARFWWIGSGSMDDEIAAYVREKGLSDKFRLLGSRDDVPDLLQGMDLFVMPSLFEGLPLTAVEAQASGLPCLLSDSITRELALSDAVAYLPLSDGPDAWAARMAAVLSAPPPRQVPDCSAFSIHLCARKLAYFYQQALGRV